MNLRRAYSLQLDKKWTEILQNLPETGMGYQEVSVTLKNGKRVEGIAFNCEILKTETQITNDDIKGI